MKTKQKTKKVNPNKGPLWHVRCYRVKGGVYTIRCGQKDGRSLGRDIVMDAARAYLREYKHLLKSIIDAYPVKSKTK